MRSIRATLFAATALLASCAPEARREDGGSILHARINADIVSSDPGTRRDLNTDAVLLHVVEGLVASREDGSAGPMLAQSWTVSPDGKRYRFALRQGVRFHNGAPLTADDVVWSFKRYLTPATHWRCGSDLGPKGIAALLEVRALDPRTVELVLDRPAPLLLQTLARADCGGTGIYHRDSVGADGSWRHPIGTGPFQWSEWRHNEYVELRRFPGYASLPGTPDGNGGGKQALVDRVRFDVIPDSSSASAALLRGSLDILDGLPPNEMGAVERAPGVSFSSAPGMDLFAMLFRTHDPVLRDARLRRAIALSLDVAALTKVATRGTGIANSSPIPAASPFFKTVERERIKRDLAAARALARAAGYKGEPIQLITGRQPPEMYDVAIIAQAMGREAGINLRVEVLDWSSQLARYSSGDYQAMVFGYSARLDPSLMFNAFLGDQQTDPRKVWDTPTARSLMSQSVAAPTPDERQAIFDKMDRAFRTEAPAVILYNSQRVTALRQGVTGFRAWPAQSQRLWNVKLAGS
ncbi:ABC transporter substrate-binding protein [Sphingomonas sp. MG17]|uniref:ABC transporter substrate-binding protein n=1 Tax=Sphingomonas tagetis TaxID=2949092 RepID=A0A9X2HIY4_9SPHN|nr:ABC transporter substrate-binding protein [Sphingomonas tagetis]MCP3729974.1 ABC transporter substrate-binding protein [Sphingomonas tagetis]